MSVQAILLPVFVQVALTFTLMFWMGYLRTVSIARKETRMGDIALGQQNWPARILKISNCYANQLQIPILFYALVALAVATRTADLTFVVLSWVFVLTRLVHAYIHIGSNFVPNRFYAFAAGGFVLLVMWLVYAGRILLAVA